MVIRDQLAASGFVVLRDATQPLDDAWRYVTELVGERPEMIERQAIRPHPRGTSFASTDVATPLHTDSQDYLGAPPNLQVMACRRAAGRGGETRLVDGWALAERLDPALLAAPRRQRFYFGDVVGPTFGIRRGHLCWTLSPIAHDDALAHAIARALADAPVIELALRDGDVLLVDNHRMLHGRAAFEGERDFTRILAWFARPLAPHPRLAPPPFERSPGGKRLDAVLELVTGGAPPQLARREGVTDAVLYAWRTRALAAALAALDEL